MIENVWPTTNGLRCLSGDESELIRGSVAMMLDHLVAEGQEGDPQEVYGIQWYDQWDWQQRIWLLERTTLALLTDLQPPSPAAIWEASIDAVFHEIRESVEMEVRHPEAIPPEKTWRESVVAAFRCQQKRDPDICCTDTNLNGWHIVITQLADAVLGVRLYLKAERFRDVDMARTQQFLMQHGLPTDFLEQIPPLRSVDQTQLSIDQIQSIVCR